MDEFDASAPVRSKKENGRPTKSPVAEKLSALRTEQYFHERSSRANVDKAKRILKRAGRGKLPVAGDEL